MEHVTARTGRAKFRECGQLLCRETFSFNVNKMLTSDILGQQLCVKMQYDA